MCNAPYNHRKSPGRAVAAFCLLLAVGHCVTARAQPTPTNSPSAPPAPGPGQMRFRVQDAETSQPVAGVKVRAWVATNLVTDDTGLCVFPLPKPASGDFSYRITITKEGYVPKFITWAKSRQDKISDIPAEYTAKMDKASTIGGVVKDQDGQPVAGARILFSGLDTSGPLEREKTTLAPNYHAERTDENGKWQCDLVPRDFEDMVFRVDQPDFLPALFGCEGSDSGGGDVTRLPAADFLAGGAVMGIRRGVELIGIIVDNAGKPVPGATVTRNHEWRNRAAVLQSDDAGEFTISNLQPGGIVLTVQAPGLEPQTLAIALSNQRSLVKVEMNPGKILKGRVLDETGKPVPGASVRMDREGFEPLEFDWSATTDRDGRFLWDSAPAGPHPYLITADGFNLRSEPALAAEDGEILITLHKTSDKIFVEGKVTDLTTHAPVGQFTILARVSNGSDVTTWTREVTNASGAYSVEVDQHATAFTLEFRAPAFLPVTTDPATPGDGDQRVNVQLEKGVGWRLAGRFAVPGYDGKISWQAGQSVVLEASVPDPDMPALDSAQAKEAWMRQFLKTDAGRAWRRAQRSFTITPDADGSFQCGEVLPGRYQLKVRLREAPELGGGPLAALTTNITIAAEAPAAGGPAMDLGLVAVPRAVHLRPGDAAPPFETKTVDGHPFKLADFRGRYVLVDFWATWCGPCLGEIPNLKDVYEKHGQDGRFVMMSLSLDAQPAQPADFARKNEIHWIQGFLGDWDNSPVPEMYGVDGIPAIFLIAPDGKIVARDLRGPDIEAAILRALGAY
ncbi:MAG: carboxypeptidase regulatory-like domain-containing protein [Verrucomicrobiota bacterium]